MVFVWSEAMSKESYCGARTGVVVTCRIDRFAKLYRVTVCRDGHAKRLCAGVSAHMLRRGQTVKLAGDAVPE